MNLHPLVCQHCTGCTCSSLPEMDIFRCPAVNPLFVGAALYENRIVLVKHFEILLVGQLLLLWAHLPQP